MSSSINNNTVNMDYHITKQSVNFSILYSVYMDPFLELLTWIMVCGYDPRSLLCDFTVTQTKIATINHGSPCSAKPFKNVQNRIFRNVVSVQQLRLMIATQIPLTFLKVKLPAHKRQTEQEIMHRLFSHSGSDCIVAYKASTPSHRI